MSQPSPETGGKRPKLVKKGQKVVQKAVFWTRKCHSKANYLKTRDLGYQKVTESVNFDENGKKVGPRNVDLGTPLKSDISRTRLKTIIKIGGKSDSFERKRHILTPKSDHFRSFWSKLAESGPQKRGFRDTLRHIPTVL